jgi:hypothetical protein
VIRLDFIGSLPKALLHGSKYFAVFMDDYSLKIWVYFLQIKGEAFSNFKFLKEMVKKATK